MTILYHSAAEAEEDFYQAFRNLDLALMRRVWVPSDAAFCIHPSGQLFRGHDSILSSWEGIFQVTEKPQFHHSLISDSRQENMTTRLVVERIGAANQAGEVSAMVLATNVYLLTELGWCMLGHHATQTRAESLVPRVGKKLH